MADFRIKKQQADVIQNADLIQNHTPVVQHGEFDAQVHSRLDDLLGRIQRSVEAAELERSTGAQLKALVEDSMREARTPAPRKSRIIAVLTRAKTITAGVATPSIIEAIDGVVTTLSS
jgi:hypothetical protein